MSASVASRGSGTARGLILRKKSRYQTIELVRDAQGLLFRLNGSPQVHSAEQVLYHENTATLPMMLARNVNRCLILGGGDGLAARNMMRFRGVKSLHLVELDPAVTDLWSDREDLSRINEGALKDPRLTLVIGDAIAWIMKARGLFDVILSDVAVAFTRQPRALTLERYFQYFAAISRKLAPGGVAVITISDDESDEVLIQALFDQFEDKLPPETKRAFVRSKDVIERTNLLTGIFFEHSLHWTIRLRKLGKHTSFYVSHQPLTRFRRFPDPLPTHIRKDFFRTTLG